MSEIPGGFIMLARKIRKSPLWLSLKCVHRIVMMEILLQAQWQDGEVVRNGEIIFLKRGQVATSYQQLIDDIGDKDVSLKMVRTAIEKLEKANFLAKDGAVSRAKKGLLLTVVNYDFYQDTENYKGKEKGRDEGSAGAERGQSEGRARAINNKDNKGNKEKKFKKEYADYVFLTEIEYGKLTELLGDDERDSYFLRYGSWISGKTKKVQDSRSAYLTILNWHRNAEKSSGGSSTVGRTGKAAYKSSRLGFIDNI